jgi:GDP-mannose transporter
MVFSGVSAFAMSYASAWCVRTTSSTTYSMVGALNKLPIAASGIVFFGDPATFANISAIFVGKYINPSGKSFWLPNFPVKLIHFRSGFVAGLVYSYAKAFPPKTNTTQSIPMSSSSQSATDATKANSD